MVLPELTRDEIERRQVERLSMLMDEVASRNSFWRAKWAGCPRVTNLGDLPQLPLTTKSELVADQEANPPYGTNLTYERSAYTRLHQTSGTRGRPLRWLDTSASWDWMLGCWRQIFEMAEVDEADRLFFPFSFGPFLGFWTAFESASRMGCMTMAAGGLSTGARVHMIVENRPTVLCCTPTYALHLAETARQTGVDLAGIVETIIVAGEPGGSIPATRRRIESAWRARVIDHTGMTEVGPLASERRDRPGSLEALENDYIVEVRDPVTSESTSAGEMGELIVTNLGRLGSPLIRYRTGDLVRSKVAATGFLQLDGGVLGRVDDMIPLRGNNFYPTALEAVVRRFPEVVEYQVEVDTTSPLAELRLEVEPTADAGEGLADRIARSIRDELLFRADVTIVAAGSLPRFEMKASRVRRR